MLKFFFIFLFFISFLRADWDQLFSDEEDPSLFHHVNVITGNLNLCLQDTIVEGAKSLPIFRTYSSAGALEPAELSEMLKIERGGWLIQGGWNFLPHANLLIEISIKSKDFKVFLPEPSGNLVAYSCRDKKGDHVLVFTPDKGFGQCAGVLSGKTNISNNSLEWNLKNGEAVLYLPNGGTRFYKGHDFRHWDIHHWRRMQNERRNNCYYRLTKEILPSGHKIEYSYDDEKRLRRTALMNPSGTKTFAWINLDLVKKDSPIAFTVKTSDNKSLHYKTLKFKEVDYLCDVRSSSRMEETNAYIKGRKGIGARMMQMNLGGKHQFKANYYIPPTSKKAKEWAEKPKKKLFETDKVNSLEAPLGPSGEMLTFARFSYHPGVTEARDPAIGTRF